MNTFKQMTQEAINKYPGTIEQLKNDWSGIIEDILEVCINCENICHNCGKLNLCGTEICEYCNQELCL